MSLRRKLMTGLMAGLALAGLAAPAFAQVHPVPEGPGPLPPAPVELWQGAVTGMTVDEVAAKFPEAKRGRGDVLGNGLMERLRIAPYPLDGLTYHVKFFFDAKHLRSVLVSLETRDRDVKETTAACDARKAALDRQYGEPTSSRANVEGEMELNRSITWADGPREVLLLCLGSKYKYSVVNMAIQPAE